MPAHDVDPISMLIVTAIVLVVGCIAVWFFEKQKMRDAKKKFTKVVKMDFDESDIYNEAT